MYSVVLMMAMQSAPDAPAGIFFHRRQAAGCTGNVDASTRSNGCSGGQAYAMVPLQTMQGCAGGFAQSASAGCTGGYGGTAIAPYSAAPAYVVFRTEAPPPLTPLRTAAKFVGYRIVCTGNRCERVAIYE